MIGIAIHHKAIFDSGMTIYITLVNWAVEDLHYVGPWLVGDARTDLFLESNIMCTSSSDSVIFPRFSFVVILNCLSRECDLRFDDAFDIVCAAHWNADRIAMSWTIYLKSHICLSHRSSQNSSRYFELLSQSSGRCAATSSHWVFVAWRLSHPSKHLILNLAWPRMKYQRL